MAAKPRAGAKTAAPSTASSSASKTSAKTESAHSAAATPAPPARPFDIGLVGAGAISAGAYSAGVVDFLVYALDSWYAERETDLSLPAHHVRLSVFSGASAGAMTAALATAYLGSDQPSIASEADARRYAGHNKLFECWVNGTDIEDLLATRDLTDPTTPIQSILDSTVLTDVAGRGLDITPRATRRPYVAENFELVMTVTNLRGVPYGFAMDSDPPSSFDMSQHADYLHFRINDRGNYALPNRYTLSWQELGLQTSAIKEQMVTAALASGAFPFGLAPRQLQHVIEGGGSDYYSARLWPVPTPDSEHPHRCVTDMPIHASWGELPANYHYQFQCVDGGVMDNEPLELARRLLAGAEGFNERDGSASDRALLLIDPFPSNSSFNIDYKPASGLLRLALTLFQTLQKQARFKPDELLLAARSSVRSRFMIAPKRGSETYAIACGSLGGFGGFLKRSFRAHDYFLGRRNAQHFLRHHFVLPEDNPLFRPASGWSEANIAQWCSKDSHGHPVLDEQGRRLLPIIPLVGLADSVECPLTPWPRYEAADLRRFETILKGRLRALLLHGLQPYLKQHRIIGGLFKVFVMRALLREWSGRVRDAVADDLSQMQLIRRQ